MHGNIAWQTGCWQVLSICFSVRGPMSRNDLYSGALVPRDKRLGRQDLQFNISAWRTIDRTCDAIILHPFPGISISPVHLSPKGRDTARLKANDPMVPPEINFNFLRSENDMRVMIKGVRIARDIARHAALQNLIVEETALGVRTSTDQEIADDAQTGCVEPASGWKLRYGPRTNGDR